MGKHSNNNPSSWRGVYKFRDYWVDRKGNFRSFEDQSYWIKARLGEFDNHDRMFGGNHRRCPDCGFRIGGLQHRTLFCTEILEDRTILREELYSIWSKKQVEYYDSLDPQGKMAMILGLLTVKGLNKGDFEKQKTVVIAFLKALWYIEFVKPLSQCARTQGRMSGYNIDDIHGCRS